MQYLSAIDQVFSNHEGTKETWESQKSQIQAQWLDDKADIIATWGNIDETETTTSTSNDKKTTESPEDHSSTTNTNGMSANDVADHLSKVTEEQAEQARQEALASNAGSNPRPSLIHPPNTLRRAVN